MMLRGKMSVLPSPKGLTIFFPYIHMHMPLHTSYLHPSYTLSDNSHLPTLAVNLPPSSKKDLSQLVPPIKYFPDPTAENISFFHILPKPSLIQVYKEAVKQPAGTAAIHSRKMSSHLPRSSVKAECVTGQQAKAEKCYQPYW